MPAILNYKICDHAPACDVRKICPVQAISYNEETKRIEIDNTKCISCGACERTCPIQAIGVARTPEEEMELLQAIEEDPRNSEDLFVDRYGADFINDDVMIETNDIEDKLKSEDCLIEVLDENNISCLLKSITYNEILENSTYKTYYRCLVADIKDVEKFGVTEFPSLLLCNNGKLKKVVSGYFEDSDKHELFKQINN